MRSVPTMVICLSVVLIGFSGCRAVPSAPGGSASGAAASLDADAVERSALGALDVRLVAEESGDGIEWARHPSSDEPLWLRVEPRLDALRVARASTCFTVGLTPAVCVELPDSEGERLLSFSAAHVGERVAILVAGEPVSIATVRSAFGRNFQIAGDFDETEAEAIVTTLQGAANGSR